MIRISFRKTATRIIGVLLLFCMLTAEAFSGGSYLCGRVFAAGDIDINNIAPGDHIYMGKRNASGFTGLPYWRVIDKDPDDGSVLLMSEYLWTGSDTEDFLQFNEIPDAGVPLEGYEDLGYMSKGSAWQGSMAQTWCKDFEAAVLSDINGMTIRKITKTDDEFQSPDDKDVTFAWSRNILNNDKVFFLSGEEAVHYMPTKSERIAFLHDGSSAGKQSAYWLRSPRLYTFSQCAGRILAYGEHAGEVARQPVDSIGAARPVFWAEFSSETRFSRCIHDGKVTWTIDPEDSSQGYRDFRYVWSADNKTCTASALCGNCGRIVRETVSSTSNVAKAASPLQEGIRTYTAVFRNDIFTTQTRQIGIPKTYDPVSGVPDSKLPKLTMKKGKSSKKTLTVRWKKLSAKSRKKISGIEIQYGTDKKFSKKPVLKKTSKKKTTFTVKKLKSRKYYWVRIRTYKMKNGIKFAGRWSKAKKVGTR